MLATRYALLLFVFTVGVLAAPGPVHRTYTFSSLPAASTMSGQVAWVSDGSASAIGSTCAGGGSMLVACKSDGSTWTVGIGAATFPIRSISAATTLGTSDYTVLCNAATSGFTVTFPLSPMTGAVLNIKKTDSTANACTIDPNGKNIDGASGTVVLNQRNQSLQFQFDGTNWWIL